MYSPIIHTSPFRFPPDALNFYFTGVYYDYNHYYRIYERPQQILPM